MTKDELKEYKENELREINDFERVSGLLKKSEPLTDVLKITAKGQPDRVFDGNGHKLTYDSSKDYYDELYSRT